MRNLILDMYKNWMRSPLFLRVSIIIGVLILAIGAPRMLVLLVSGFVFGVMVHRGQDVVAWIRGLVTQRGKNDE